MTSGSEIWHDQDGTMVINETTVPDSEVWAALQQDPELAALTKWSMDTQSVNRRAGNLIHRDRYIAPQNVYEQMRLAYETVQRDDVVGGVADMSEALSIKGVGFECEDEDEEDVWNQIADEIDLAARFSEMWRELFTVSQFYVATYYASRSYKVRGERRKKTVKVRAPIGMTLIDPLKVVPVGNFMFGRERLCYIADRTEAPSLDEALAQKNTTDQVVEQLLETKYNPTELERSTLADLDIDPDRLYLFKKDRVWRCTDTRAGYERFANVRLRSVFELLDLKNQLREMDRAHLLGASNFIVLIRKGTDQHRATPAEIKSLQSSVRQIAKVPLIVGDHRLQVDIVTPKVDNTLKPERYNSIDSRISARLFGMFFTGSYQAGTRSDDSIKLAKVVARGLEARREVIRRALMRNVFEPTQKANPEVFKNDFDLGFFPKRIGLEFDPAFASMLQDLRDRGDISRESILDELDFDQDDEARRRKNEREKYDDVFKPVNVPFDSPNKGQNPNGDEEDDPHKDDPGLEGREGRRKGGNNRQNNKPPDAR